MRKFPILAVSACFLGTLAVASANPVNVDPIGTVRSYVFFLIAAGCIAIETSILCMICRVFHKADCPLGMKISIVVLNIATLLIILMPLHRLSNSIIIAELGVIVAETIGIQAIFSLNAVRLTLVRAFSYSLGVNLVSYVIGVLCQ